MKEDKKNDIKQNVVINWKSGTMTPDIKKMFGVLLSRNGDKENGMESTSTDRQIAEMLDMR